MKLKSILIAASIASLAAPALANNNTNNLGPVAAPYASGISEFHFQVGAFLDYISFSVASSSNLTLTLVEIPNVVHPAFGPPIVVWSIPPTIAGGLFVDNGGMVDPPGPIPATWVPNAGAGVGPGYLGWGTYNFNNVAAGNYVFSTWGTASGTYGGTYLASVAVAAVPEPESYAMLLAGLGLLGFVARRRSRS